MTLTPLDLSIFIGYFIIIISIGLFVSRNKKNAEDYFLAGKSLPWWAIGASLIAANISAEQFIGMSGSGFAIGLAIASYEWMAAITLLIVGKFFLPIFVEKKLYTIPQFIEKRFSENLKTILAIFWISLFVFVNLTSVLYLGAKALDTIIGTGDGSMLLYSIIGLALFACVYSLWGGLSSVAWTDVVQVAILIFGGLITVFIAITHISDDGGILSGFVKLYEVVPEKFSMILSPGEIITPDGKDAWWDLPGIAVIIGGMWVANLYYWGFNQYIIQRTLAAKNLGEAQKGIAFAALLKLIIPLIVVIPGIIAYVLNADPTGAITLQSVDPSFIQPGGQIDNDSASPWLIKKFIPAGLQGLVIAGITAAIVSSLASMLNSTSTIFTMDIYIPYIDKNADGKKSVTIGRISALVAMIIAILIAPQLNTLEQAFQFIQEYTGIVSPGILAVFMMGLFWKRATNNAAILGAIISIPVALFLKIGPKEWIDSGFFPVLPFLTQMLITCIFSIIVIAVVSHIEGKGKDNKKAIKITKNIFETPPAFNISAVAVLTICSALYIIFW